MDGGGLVGGGSERGEGEGGKPGGGLTARPAKLRSYFGTSYASSDITGQITANAVDERQRHASPQG